MNPKAMFAVVVLATMTTVPCLSASTTAGRPQASLPRLVDLGADKCIPCKLMAPILQQLKKDYAGRLEVEFVDVWKNPGAASEYGIKLIPTQIFYGADGKELFRHEGFYAREDILGKWKELSVDLAGKPSADLVREAPVKADTRPPEAVCFMCDGDVNPKTKALVKGQTEQRVFCSPHCYFIYFSSLVGADATAEDAKVKVTDCSTGKLIPASTATFLYGLDSKGRATIGAFRDRAAALTHQPGNTGNLVGWDVLRSKELATRCGFCDRAVYPEDACVVRIGTAHGYGCCTHCSLGVAARLQKDIEVDAKDALTGESIHVKTLDGKIGLVEPSSAVAWFGQRKGPDGKWASAGCFKQGFFANQENLRKWLEAHPASTGRQITIAQALADKMKLTPEQIAKACKLGECK